MSLSIAGIVGGGLLLVAVGGGVAGLYEHDRQKRSKWAAQTWRDVTLRNGVTGKSPFHSDDDSFNAPGMVQVYPRSQVRSASPFPSSDSTAVVERTRVTPVEELTEELPCAPMELSDPPHEAERARVRRLHQQGLSQTKLIKEVWGLSKGGSKRYYEARRRYRNHIADIATGELLESIQQERGEASA